MFRKTPDELADMGRKSQERILAICDDAAIIRRHRDYYTALNQKASEAARQLADRKVPDTGVILFDDGVEPRRAARAFAAIDVQTIPAAAKIVVGQALSADTATNAELAAWTCIPSDAEGLRSGLMPLAERLAAVSGELPQVVYVGSAGDILAPDALRQAANTFANRPECGWCGCWTSTGGSICAAFRNEPAHFLAPANFPERWFLRTQALAQCGGLIVEGYFLPDILRDVVLRMIAKGWRGGCIASPLVEVANREPGPVVTPFAFSERRDSIRAVALAHKYLFSTDPVTACEALEAVRKVTKSAVWDVIGAVRKAALDDWPKGLTSKANAADAPMPPKPFGQRHF